MSIVATISNVQMSAEVISTAGALATVSLIVFAFIALLVSDSRYWDRWIRGTLDIVTYPLLLTFAAIVVFRIVLVL